MREYKDRKNAQKKHYYKDPFYQPEKTQKFDIEGSEFEEDIEFLKSKGIEILDSYVELNQLVIYVDKEQNLTCLSALKEFGYEVLCEISAVDLIAKKGGFEVFYQLLSVLKTKRARLKCFIRQGEMLKSVTSVYKSANWSEREMYDMFGILIKDHPNLKRLIMPDDWHSYPLLKSYPLHGDEQARWYEVDKIFGREYREVIGPENRDSAMVDSKDTFNFSRIYHEVERGAKPRDEKILQEYQEEGGVALVKRLKREKAKILKKRP
ncbi:NADH-quinone oxidoreductase subunit C [Campylobacter sp.]|uniref:NADH-quinone oxidoreductase subunit C n=1 Tax=Campylobacter sp. TaxID=205 RepID=UPI002707D083|nr:NADH-quinone oxidoreductase subunit C [Campylobacter sp.]